MTSFTYATDSATPVHPVSALDYLPVDQMRALQLHRLQFIVKYAYERVRLFRKRCDERGVRPEHIKTLKDIKLLPFSMTTAPLARPASRSASRTRSTTSRSGRTA